jgi:hypothetical protein
LFGFSRNITGEWLQINTVTDEENFCLIATYSLFKKNWFLKVIHAHCYSNLSNFANSLSV